MGLRIRSIKPEILTDEKSAALTDTEWRLFVSCIVISDDYGNFRASPAFLYSQAFWASSTSREDVAKAIETLARLSLVVLYTVGCQSYGHISGWDKHQKVDHPGKPLCPSPEQGIAITYSNSSRDSRETLAKVPETLAPDRDRDRDKDQDQGPGPRNDPTKVPQGGQLALVGNVQARTRKRREQVETEGFLKFWAAYPLKKAKGNALKAWPGDELTDLILAALSWQVPTWGDPQFMKHPATWLNARCWEDEKPQPVQVGGRY